MLAVERQHRILEIARREGTVRTTELANSFSVTEETIRRDLDLLTRRNQLRRTHGGAMDVARSMDELSQSERETRQLDEKRMIARYASGLVMEGETLLLDASTSALEMASWLPERVGLRVVTYSLAVVERLAGRDGVDLVQLGGVYERRGRRFSGMLTEMALRSLRIDRFFFSGGGFDPVLGVGEPNPDQARLKRMMLEHAAWSCALLDFTKLGASTDNYFARPEEFQVLITDPGGEDFVKNHIKNPTFEMHFSR